MASAWETIRDESRRSRRYKLALTASVSIDEFGDENLLPTILAHTRDVSRHGLCLVVPAVGLIPHDLKVGTDALRTFLVLPEGRTVEVVGVSIYCHEHNVGDIGRGYLVGVKLEESEDRSIYHEFIESLYRR